MNANVNLGGKLAHAMNHAQGYDKGGRRMANGTTTKNLVNKHEDSLFNPEHGICVRLTKIETKQDINNYLTGTILIILLGALIKYAFIG